jgi:hypothetical protein
VIRTGSPPASGRTKSSTGETRLSRAEQQAPVGSGRGSELVCGVSTADTMPSFASISKIDWLPTLSAEA